MVAVRVAEVAVESPINRFLVGDIFQMCFNPKDEKPEWFQVWKYPLRDAEDIAHAKEIVATSGDCLGWGHAATKEKWGYRTITPPAPIVVIAKFAEVDHWRNTKTGALLGGQSKL